jgi:dTDP-glucose 4,6-dehydratase
MKLLVTGAAGFIGSNFVRLALQREPGVEVVVLDALRYSGRKETLADVWDRITFIQAEIQDRTKMDEVLERERPTHVVNFAAESHNDRSILDNTNFVLTNSLGVQVLLDSCRAHGVERVLHVSTDEVYGSTLDGNFTEESPLQPNTPYSAAKAGGDLICRAHFHAYKTPVIVTRGGNTYGPYHYPEKLIPFFVTRLIDGKKVPLYGEGTQVREWIHVMDHAAGIWAALTKGEPGQVYNVGDSNERQNRETVTLLLDELGLGNELVKQIPDPRKGAHDARYSMDSSKLRSLGWKPERPFEESLRETVRWFRANEAWWRPILADPGYQAFIARFYCPGLGDDL